MTCSAARASKRSIGWASVRWPMLRLFFMSMTSCSSRENEAQSFVPPASRRPESGRRDAGGTTPRIGNPSFERIQSFIMFISLLKRIGAAMMLLAASQVLLLLAMRMLSRRLGEQGYGQYGLAMSIGVYSFQFI